MGTDPHGPLSRNSAANDVQSRVISKYHFALTAGPSDVRKGSALPEDPQDWS
jgi:hypothetical protein